MALGIGVDMVSVKRIEGLLQTHGPRFRRRLFTPEERQHCGQGRREGECLAVRFAAKEALYKALYPTFRPTWQEVEVAKKAGKPVFVFHGGLKEYMEAEGLQAHVSLSHERNMACAFVIIIREGAES